MKIIEKYFKDTKCKIVVQFCLILSSDVDVCTCFARCCTFDSNCVRLSRSNSHCIFMVWNYWRMQRPFSLFLIGSCLWDKDYSFLTKYYFEASGAILDGTQ